MRHVLVTIDFPPSRGGVARYYEHLVAALPPGTVDVVAPKARGLEQEPTPRGMRVYRRTLLSRFLWPRWLPLLFHMAWLVLRGYRSFWVGQVLPVGTAALILHTVFRIRYLVLTHGLDVTSPVPGSRRARLRNAVLRSAWLVTANSEYTKQQLRSCGVPEEKILLLQPGCSFRGDEADTLSVQALRERLDLSGKRVLLTVGRLVQRKGIDTLLHALASFVPAQANFCSLIVGDGPERAQLEKLAAELGLRATVHFLGDVDETTLPALYALCDAFVLTPHAPSDSRDPEGFGIVYLEANAFGKPVVGTKTGGVPDAIVEGATGLLVPPDDPKALAETLQNLLRDEALRSRLGAAGQQYVREHCQWSQRVKPLLEKVQSSKDKGQNV